MVQSDDTPGDVKIQLILQGIGDRTLDFAGRVQLRQWVGELVQLAGDAVSGMADLRTKYATHTYDHPDDELRILTLRTSEALIAHGRKVLGWDKEGSL